MALKYVFFRMWGLQELKSNFLNSGVFRTWSIKKSCRLQTRFETMTNLSNVEKIEKKILSLRQLSSKQKESSKFPIKKKIWRPKTSEPRQTTFHLRSMMNSG